MFNKLKALKEWWPLASSIAVAAFTLATKIFAAKSQAFLFVRLFRYEFLLLVLVLLAATLVKVFLPRSSRWHPREIITRGTVGLRLLAARRAKTFERAAGAVLAASGLFFLLALGQYATDTFQFLSERYEYADRQALLAQAVKAEEEQKLLRAVAIYKDVIERFPNEDFNHLTETQIARVRTRYTRWVAASQRVEKNARGGLALTKYDQIIETCRYVSNAGPCLRLEAYLGPVETLVSAVHDQSQPCSKVVAAIPRKDHWILMDPNDRAWRKIDDAASLCRVLGLKTNADLAEFLEARWYITQIRTWQNPQGQDTFDETAI